MRGEEKKRKIEIKTTPETKGEGERYPSCAVPQNRIDKVIGTPSSVHIVIRGLFEGWYALVSLTLSSLYPGPFWPTPSYQSVVKVYSNRQFMDLLVLSTFG